MAVITRSTSLPRVRMFEGEFGITRRHWHMPALLVEHGAITAGWVSRRYDIAREAQDAYAGQLQQRIAAAQQAGRLDAEIVRITTSMAVVDKATKR